MPLLGPPEALSPRDWNAIVDYDQWRDLFSPDDGVALHHGGGSDYQAGRAPFSQAREIQQLQQWEGYHIYSKGWRGLAYGWGVGQTGTIYRARGWATYGAHTGDLDGDGIANNAEIVPIIFVGSGNHHDLSPDAQASIATLRRFIEEGSPNATRLYGHQELRGTVTQCPGPKGMDYVKAHRLLEPEEDMAFSKGLSADEWRELYNLGIAHGTSADAVANYWTDSRRTDEQHEKVSANLFVALAKAESNVGTHTHDGRYVKNVSVSK